MKTIVSLALAIVVSTTSVFAQKNSRNKKNEVKTPQEEVFAPSVEGPEISFEKLVHNYGEIAYGSNGDCEFTFTNVGSEPLILSNVQSSCGCTTPNWPKEPIMPGQTGVIKVHYDTTRTGGIGKSITVTTNGKTDRVVLRITGTVLAKVN